MWEWNNLCPDRIEPPKGFPLCCCNEVEIELEVPETIGCGENAIAGVVLCDGDPIKGVKVRLSSDIPSLTFTKNVSTNKFGIFSAQVIDESSPRNITGHIFAQVRVCGKSYEVAQQIRICCPFSVQRAYIANNEGTTVSVVDVATNTIIAEVGVGENPIGVAITPDGTRVYVTNGASDDVSVIDTITNTTVVPSIPVGESPRGIAITPDGTRAYVVNFGSVMGTGTVSVIDTATNEVVDEIDVGGNPFGIAITPDGAKAYVTDSFNPNIFVINTADNTFVTVMLVDVVNSNGIAITPDGDFAYVTNLGSDAVSVIETTNDTVPIAPILVGGGPFGIAITPDGTRAYVTNGASDDVSVIHITTNTVLGDPIPVGDFPREVAITPDGRFAYVTNLTTDNVSVIDTATNEVVTTITGFANPFGIAIGTVHFSC